METKDFLTVKDLSEILDITERTARDILSSGNIKGRLVAGKYITTREALKEYIEGTAR